MTKFNAREVWAALPKEQQQAIGEAALLLHVSTEAQAEWVLEEGFPPIKMVERRWEKAEQLAWRMLGDNAPAVVCEPSLYADGPDFAAIGVSACRVCGCTEENACPGGCSWVEPDLCSQCVGKNPVSSCFGK